MIEWGLLAKVAGGGFGMVIFVLVILSIVAWIVGLVVQRTVKPAAESKKDSGKG